MPEIKVLGEYRCPNCGSSQRAFTVAHEDLVERGLHEPFVVYYSRRETLPLIDPMTASLSVPMIVIYWDICIGCGKLYIFRIDTQDAPIKFGQLAPGQDN